MAALDEEQRLAYVGATRARRRLFLMHARRRSAWGPSNACAALPCVVSLQQQLDTTAVLLAQCAILYWYCCLLGSRRTTAVACLHLLLLPVASSAYVIAQCPRAHWRSLVPRLKALAATTPFGRFSTRPFCQQCHYTNHHVNIRTFLVAGTRRKDRDSCRIWHRRLRATSLTAVPTCMTLRRMLWVATLSSRRGRRSGRRRYSGGSHLRPQAPAAVPRPGTAAAAIAVASPVTDGSNHRSGCLQMSCAAHECRGSSGSVTDLGANDAWGFACVYLYSKASDGCSLRC